MMIHVHETQLDKFHLPFPTPTGSSQEDIPAALHVGQQTDVLPTMPCQNLL